MFLTNILTLVRISPDFNLVDDIDLIEIELLLIVLILTHRKNIVRLIQGNESKITKDFFKGK